jgi:hypothetical protein
MFRKLRKAEQTIEPQKEVKESKGRFQIVKLEERIAPHCGFHRNGVHNPFRHYRNCV